jgi:L-fuconolactonase
MSARVAPYDQIVARTAVALPPLGAAGDAAFWGGTARELYRL